ncbi:MAG: hypothetical protein ACRD0U_06575 [Acidimicrobiales bacterium]
MAVDTRTGRRRWAVALVSSATPAMMTGRAATSRAMALGGGAGQQRDAGDDDGEGGDE